MKKIASIALAGFFLVAAAEEIPLAYAQSERVESGDLIQITDLVAQSMSPTASPPEVAATLGGTSTCKKYDNLDAETGTSLPCPIPSGSVFRIQIKSDTKVLLKTRASAKISDFGAGDRVNAFGFYNQDGSIRAFAVRNLTKPVERQDLQLEGVEVLGVVNSNPISLIVAHEPELPCFRFQGNVKKTRTCPLGIRTTDAAALKGIRIPETYETKINFVRRYEIQLGRSAAIFDAARKPLSVGTIEVGDTLNVYGLYAGGSAELIDAEVIRDLSKPKTRPASTGHDAVITRINADGTLTVRLRDGRVFDVETPYQANTFVTIKGLLDETKSLISGVTEIIVRKADEVTAPPIIAEVKPGFGPIGAAVLLTGSGFTPTGNHVNFGNVPRAASNLASPDGKTLTFVIPSVLCTPRTVCSGNAPSTGNYSLVVENERGVSNTVTFRLTELPPLNILTETVPQSVENERYVIVLGAQGGMNSYVWRVSNGNLPSGIELISGQCEPSVVGPCRAPAKLSGIPRVPGTYSFTITVASGSEISSRSYTIVVVPSVGTGTY